MVYGGYFIMAIPAGIIIRKWGYKAGVLTGLVLYGIGALLFIPGEMIMSFNFFLVCLFVIGCPDLPVWKQHPILILLSLAMRKPLPQDSTWLSRSMDWAG